VSVPELEPTRTALVLFDTLNGHLKTEAGIREPFREAVANMRRLLDASRASGVLVAYAVASHRADGRIAPLQRTDTDNRLRPWPDGVPDRAPAVIAGTWGGEVIDELRPAAEDLVVPKIRWSAFFGTYLDFALRVRGIGTVIVAGGSTDVGVASTAFAARDLGYEIVIPRDACTAHELDNQEQLMRRVFPRMARVRTTAEIVAMLARS
jgi:nicotinamidase-related amidase